MTDISFTISTDGKSDDRINLCIDSIENLKIPNYEIIIVGGLETSIKRKNVFHLPFYEQTKTGTPWMSKKKNLSAWVSHFENLVMMNDYYKFDENWYEEFIKFGDNWDVQIQQQFILPELGGYRYNGWRVDHIPGYPEIPYNMAVPWDIDQLLPYMAITGAFWVIKRNKMLAYPYDENLYYGQCDDIEWSSRIVPGWMGQKLDQLGLKIVANPNCVSRLTKEKTVWPCGPDQYEISESLNWLWDEIRANKIRPGTVYYDKKISRVIRA